ncbi:MAG: putative 2OG-Fe(II) oxygenase [Gammaproteobacteria bacterium]
MKPLILPIFPEPIVAYNDVEVDLEKIHGLYDKQEWKSTNSEDNADYFLQISKNLKVLDENANLKKAFVDIINDYTKNVMLYENTFYMTTSWFTKTEKNKISVLHNHGNAMFSAVYYFDLPEGKKSKITFEKPVTNQFDLKPTTYNVLNGPSYVFELGNDTVLIFPSYLKHKVNRHENDAM